MRRVSKIVVIAMGALVLCAALALGVLLGTRGTPRAISQPRTVTAQPLGIQREIDRAFGACGYRVTSAGIERTGRSPRETCHAYGVTWRPTQPIKVLSLQTAAHRSPLSWSGRSSQSLHESSKRCAAVCRDKTLIR